MDCQVPLPIGISQARILEWVAISFFRGSSWPRNQTCVSWIAGGFFTTEPPGKPLIYIFMSHSSVQSVQFSHSFVSDSLQPQWTAAHQASLSITNSQSLLKVMSIKSVMPSNHLILCHPLLLPPSAFLSIRVFSSESVLHIRWPKYWSFSFSISPFNEYSGMISFRIDWLDFLAAQVTLKSLPQYYSTKVSILQCSAFFIVYLSHPYMTTGKTIALTRWTFVDKVTCLLFNLLSRLVTAFSFSNIYVSIHPFIHPSTQSH